MSAQILCHMIMSALLGNIQPNMGQFFFSNCVCEITFTFCTPYDVKALGQIAKSIFPTQFKDAVVQLASFCNLVQQLGGWVAVPRVLLSYELIRQNTVDTLD